LFNPILYVDKSKEMWIRAKISTIKKVKKSKNAKCLKPVLKLLVSL